MVTYLPWEPERSDVCRRFLAPLGRHKPIHSQIDKEAQLHAGKLAKITHRRNRVCKRNGVFNSVDFADILRQDAIDLAEFSRTGTHNTPIRRLLLPIGRQCTQTKLSFTSSPSYGYWP